MFYNIEICFFSSFSLKKYLVFAICVLQIYCIIPAIRIYLFLNSRERRITLFLGNELANQPNCRGLHRFACSDNLLRMQKIQN